MSSTMMDAALKTFATALVLSLEVIGAANAVPTGVSGMDVPARSGLVQTVTAFYDAQPGST